MLQQLKTDLSNSVSPLPSLSRRSASPPDGVNLAPALRRKPVFNYVLVCLLCTGLFGLIWFSHRLAGMRIYQVDECQNVYSARILATGQAENFYLNLSLFHFPLAWVSRGATRAVDFFGCARFLSLEIFWLNLVLIGLATGERLLSLRGLVALVGAATLAPLWDYGFEIRHDSLILTGLLLTWLVVRVRPGGKHSYLIAGAIAVALEFVAFKALVYTAPLSLAFLVFPPPGHRASRGKLVLSWLAGALGMLLLVRFLYGAAGLWEIYLAGLQRISNASTGGNRFAPWQTLGRLPAQTPLLLALVAAAMVALALDLRRRGRAGLTWQGNLPEALLFGGAFAGLLLNPVPYPYNLLHLVPFAFLLAFRHASRLWREGLSGQALAPVALSLLIFAHFVPFMAATRRHLDWTNFHQEATISLAEDLTDPSRDRVYDGIGMVPTRPSIDYRWFLHSLNVQGFIKGPGPRVREMLAARPPAVLIQSYRTDWLTDEDHEFIKTRYVPLADDFWVLGTVLPSCTGIFEIVHPGRYQIGWIQDSEKSGTNSAQAKRITEDQPFTCKLDGALLSKEVVDLSLGIHQIETTPDRRATVTWLGPRLNRVPQLSARSRLALFINWY